MANDYCNRRQDCFVKNLTISSTGLSLKSKWLTPYNFIEGGEASMLVLPEYLVVTTHPALRQQLAAIQELQFRQDELKQDFSFAIQHLAHGVSFCSSELSSQ